MSRWSASLHLEMSRLGFSEADWKLPSHGVARTRTRHGGHGRPDLRRREKEQESTSESEDSEWSRGGSEESTTDEDLDLSKPPSTRVIVEVEGLKKTFEKNCKCPNCHGNVLVTFRTICLATSIILQCKDPSCGYIYYGDSPAQVTIEGDFVDKRERSTDYAINILYVLGFISCGDGCTEAARLLGLLGLPNDTTMETRSFGIIEDRICKHVHSVTDGWLRSYWRILLKKPSFLWMHPQFMMKMTLCCGSTHSATKTLFCQGQSIPY